MKVGQYKMSSLLLFLILLTNAASANDAPSVNVPLGVGFSHDVKSLDLNFGIFGNYTGLKGKFGTCGHKTITTMNPQIKTAASNDISVTCEPNPTRIIVKADGSPVDFGKFVRTMKDECELLTCLAEDVPKAGSTLGTMQFQTTQTGIGAGQVSVINETYSILAGVVEDAKMRICGTKKVGWSNGPTGNVLFAGEGGTGKCYRQYSDLRLRVEKEEYIQIPRWLEPGQSVKNVRPFFFDAQDALYKSRLPYIFDSTTSMDGKKYKKCNTACDSGKIVKVGMKSSAYQMAISINSKKCKSFRICFNAEGFEDDSRVPKCTMSTTIDILIDAGVVVWPNEGRASMIELRSSVKDMSHVTVIEFGYGAGKNKADPMGEYYVGNDHREIVTSSSKGFSQAGAMKLTFIFPVEDCLYTTAGIFSKHINYAKTLSSLNVTEGGLYDDVTLTPITRPTLEKPRTATTPSLPVNFPSTTTPMPVRPKPDAKIVLKPGEAAPIQTDDNAPALFTPGKWWIWGIYVGFILGTIATLAIGGAIFYFLRRTVFAIWYRGMYKRYGCDASGTTGGITGIGFGNTTTGSETVLGTTGGGNTTSTGGGGGKTKTSTSMMSGTSTGTTGGSTEQSPLLGDRGRGTPEKTEQASTVVM